MKDLTMRKNLNQKVSGNTLKRIISKLFLVKIVRGGGYRD
jgi:hypothetical protein